MVFLAGINEVAYCTILVEYLGMGGAVMGEAGLGHMCDPGHTHLQTFSFLLTALGSGRPYCHLRLPVQEREVGGGRWGAGEHSDLSKTKGKEGVSLQVPMGSR